MDEWELHAPGRGAIEAVDLLNERACLVLQGLRQREQGKIRLGDLWFPNTPEIFLRFLLVKSEEQE